MSIAFRKVWRDLWRNKSRTALVVLSIAVGVLAVGMITTSNSLLGQRMAWSQTAANPSNIILYLRRPIDDDTVRAFSRLPGVSDAEGVASMSVRWRVSPEADWQSASVTALDDYNDQTFDLVTLREGRFPTSDSVAVEFNHVSGFGAPAVGQTVYFEVNNRAKPIVVGGLVRDPLQFPPPFASEPAFYATRDMLALLGGTANYTQLKLAIPAYTKAQADAIADEAEQRLNKMGVSVGFVQTQDPERHFLQDMMDGVGLILSVMAAMSLGLSTILVINTINAVIAQQVPQIGIMKTVGGLSGQIGSLYLAGVAVYGLLSLAIAVPLGALGGNALASWMLTVINIPASPLTLLRASLVYQLGTGLLAPLLAALYPVAQGVAISVREAIGTYGVGQGRYGRGWLDKLIGRVQGLPRMATLSLRNTFRRAGRVALTEITLIAAGTIFMMVVSTHYSFNRTIEKLFDSFGFDVLVGFEQPQRIDKIVPMLEAQPGVTHAEMWVWRTAKALVPGADGPGSRHEVFLRGVPLNSQMYVPDLLEGRTLLPADGHALLLNQKLARKMGLNVGDVIELELGDSGRSSWTIVGLIFDLGGRDQNTAYLNRDMLSRELGSVGRATVAEVQTIVKTRAAQEVVEKSLRLFFESQGIGVSFTDTALKNQEQANAQFSILTTILLIMVLLMAMVGSFGLSGTLSINVLERRREIGVMRAVGASSIDVALIFMGEGLMLGLLSWAQAVPISLFASRFFVEAIGVVIDFPAQYYFSQAGVWIWLAIVVTLSLLASWLPSRRATQISVRESLAYE